MAPLLSHVGMTVGDIRGAIDFYRDVFGAQPVAEPYRVKRDGSYAGEMYAKVLDERFKESLVVFMTTSEHILLEIFQFIDPPVEVKRDNFPYWQTGVSHICFVREDIDQAVSDIVKHGGRDRSGVLPLFESGDAKVAFCEDPWGNLIELFNVNNPDMFAAAMMNAAKAQK